MDEDNKTTRLSVHASASNPDAKDFQYLADFIRFAEWRRQEVKGEVVDGDGIVVYVEAEKRIIRAMLNVAWEIGFPLDAPSDWL